MNPQDDPFFTLAGESLADGFDALQNRPMASGASDARATTAGVALGRLQGFDILEQALVSELPATPGQVLSARSTVALRRAMVGRQVVVMYEQGDPQRPIVLGVIEPHPLHDAPVPQAGAGAGAVQVQVEGERRTIEAEREIVLRCGDASITLTRAGKVIIRGSYILSRSTGYNKIKGAAIDIN